uniref:Uncharacterized protein n=1 Tax=Anopheles maculatus TaxID=74869 RepID=A0A182T4V8_9DIPT
MVQGVRLPVAAPLPPDFGYGAIAELGLEPGPQPTMGYAPKASSERKSSYYREQIEQSLLESMDKEPERVPAGGVKIIPPSPRKKSKQATGQSDTAGGAPAPLEQPAEPQQGQGAKTKSPFTATESEYESDLDGTGARRQNGYLADTEEVVQKTAAVSFEQQQTIESFSSSSKETVEESKSSFLVNNDLPEDLQPVKVLPTEEPLPTLKHVPVPAAVQPVPEQAPAPEPQQVVEPQQPLQ